METDLLKQIRAAVSYFDDQELAKLLQQIDYTDQEPERLDALLAFLTNECTEKNNKNAFKMVVKEWAANNIMEEQLPTLTYMFTMRLVGDKTLELAKDLFPEYSFYEHFTNLLDYKNNYETVEGLDRLDQIYQENRLFVYLSLYSYVVAQEEFGLVPNVEGKHFIIAKLKQLHDYAPVGSWVRDLRKKSTDSNKVIDLTVSTVIETKKEIDLPFEDELIVPKLIIQTVKKLPPEDMYVDILTLGQKENKQATQEKLKKFYRSKIDLQSKLAPLQEVLRREQLAALSDNKTIFQIMGPVNTLNDSHFPEHEQCSWLGGCRMLGCSHQPDDWFSGNCDNCYRKIKYPHHCVRLPLENGGWQGCYCSFDCVLKKNTEDISSVSYDMIKYYQNRINAIGIQDRKMKK